MDTRGSRSNIVVVAIAVTAFAWLLVGDRALTHWAYALERGRIQASAEELKELEPAIADLQNVSRAFALVAKVASPSVVHLRVAGGRADEDAEDPDGEDFPRELRRRFMQPMGSGSGIIFDKDGYILTNNHVVQDREEIIAILADEREFTARVIGTDPKTDLAVVKIDAPNLAPIRFGNSDDLEIGEWVVAVGSPFGLQQTVTHGIVSAKGRTRVPGIDIDYQDFIQTDAAINPGNSGGPLLNLRGEVIGVNTAIATRGEGYNAGVAFSIPSKLAMRIANELRETGTIRRGWIGISYRAVEPDQVERLGLENTRGVIIDRVQRRSPADKAGLQVEDIIVEFDGRSIQNIEQLRAIVGDMKPEERVKLRLIRDGAERRIDLRLALQPDNTQAIGETDWIIGRSVTRLGLDVRTFPMSLLSRLSGDEQTGVLVTRVQDDGPAALAIKPGDRILNCNGEPVRNVSELTTALDNSRPDGTIRLQVLSDGERKTVTLSSERGEK